ncbi:MAG: TlpA family protein disulfide reductase [Acidobacteriota bacterium]
MTKIPALVTALLSVLALGVLVASDRPPAGGVPVAPAGPGGAMNLTLAPGLSFTDDSSSNFPIRGESLSDGRIASDRPTAIFFGTSHCWNTNREAERFVQLYRRHGGEARFLVVDLDHPSPDQRALVSRFFGGYIPHVTFLDRRGQTVYNRAGETASERGDVRALEEILRRAR